MYILNGHPNPISRLSYQPLKLIACTILAPLLLIAALGALVCVTVDFACFRTHTLLAGSPQPKGLWEF
jgi:hypothetical protein